MNALFIPISFERKEPGKASRVSWPFTVVCCLYFLFAYRGLAIAVPIFGEMLTGLGVALPLPTRFLLANYFWLFPVCFCGAVILAIFKQVVPLDKLRLRITNVILIFVGVAVAPLVVLTIYLPLFELMYKLQFAR